MEHDDREAVMEQVGSFTRLHEFVRSLLALFRHYIITQQQSSSLITIGSCTCTCAAINKLITHEVWNRHIVATKLTIHRLTLSSLISINVAYIIHLLARFDT